ncbi:MAG: hypothetical protein QNK79_10085 [Synechococcus sp. ArSW.bin.68]
MTFQPAQMITARTIHPKKARRSTKPIKSTIAVPATFLTMALLFSDMYCQRGIKAMTKSKYVATVPLVSISVTDEQLVLWLSLPDKMN